MFEGPVARAAQEARAVGREALCRFLYEVQLAEEPSRGSPKARPGCLGLLSPLPVKGKSTLCWDLLL